LTPSNHSLLQKNSSVITGYKESMIDVTTTC
jgi:hypothetical protein